MQGPEDVAYHIFKAWIKLIYKSTQNQPPV